MSSRTDTIMQLRRQLAAAEGRMASLMGAIEEFQQLKSALVSAVVKEAQRSNEERVEIESFAELAVDISEKTTLADLAVVAPKGKAQAHQVLDFSRVFAHDIAVAEQAEVQQTGESYVNTLVSVTRQMVAFTESERRAQRQFLEKCERIAKLDVNEKDARAHLDLDFEALSAELMADRTDERRDAYMNYLTACKLMGERPKELGFHQMLGATEDLLVRYAAQRERHAAINQLAAEMGRRGLKNVGHVVFDDEEGNLIVDESDTRCAIFMTGDSDGSFVFTTVASVDPYSVGSEERTAIKASAERLCKTKDSIFKAVAESTDIEFKVLDELPATSTYVMFSQAFADYVAAKADKSRTAERGTTAGNVRRIGQE